MAESVGSRLIEAGKAMSDDMPATTLPECDKIERYLDALASQVPDNPHLNRCVDLTKPAILLVLRVALCCAPFYAWMAKWTYRFYKILPTNIIQMIFGAALCFFGGTYVASIAAIEAVRQMGYEGMVSNLKVVAQQANLIKAASDVDDKVDADADGIADVDQIGPAELFTRKLRLGMKTVKEPERLQLAVGALWAPSRGRRSPAG